jgi:hypothetical protein
MNGSEDRRRDTAPIFENTNLLSDPEPKKIQKAATVAGRTFCLSRNRADTLRASATLNPRLPSTSAFLFPRFAAGGQRAQLPTTSVSAAVFDTPSRTWMTSSRSTRYVATDGNPWRATGRTSFEGRQVVAGTSTTGDWSESITNCPRKGRSREKPASVVTKSWPAIERARTPDGTVVAAASQPQRFS